MSAPLQCVNEWNKTENRLWAKSSSSTEFKQPLTADLDRAKAMSNATGVFITADMKLYSDIKNKEFKQMD